MAAPQPRSPRHGRSYSADDSLELSQASLNYNPYTFVMQSPNPFMNPINGGSQRSLQMLHPSESVSSAQYSNHKNISSSFDFDAYERWNQGWYQR
jgi:hypothetical protein